MNSIICRRNLPVFLLSAALLLSGCLEHDAKPAAAAAPNPGAHDVAMARGKVEVPGGLLEVMSPMDGLVDSVAVQEGDAVKRGQLLVKLAPEPSRMEVELARAELRLAEARQQAQALRLPAARRLAERTAEAARAGAVDPQRAEEALQTQRDVESAISVLAAERAVAQQKLAQAQWLAQRQTVTAAADASVLKLNVQPGVRVAAQAGKPMMVLLPHRALIVRAEVNESYLSRIQVGSRANVAVETEAAGGERTPPLAAHVVRISPAYSASRLDDDVAARSNVRVVDCFLEIDSTAPQLRLGQDVRVSFHE